MVLCLPGATVQAICDRILRILKWKGEQPEIVVHVDTNAMAVKNSEHTLSSIAKIEDEISQLTKTITNSKQTLISIPKIQDEISQLSKNTATSIASVKNELSQWKSNVAEKFTKTGSSITKLQDDILQWSNNRLRCPTEWTRFRESCYHFSSSTKTWGEAQRQCASLDGHLVVINNAEEQERIRQNVNNNYWIGLNDIVQEGIWHWVDGTDYSSNVKFWESSQPNGHEEFDEDCALVSGGGLWHDWPCDSMHFAICEKRAA
ncbi:CD209 antigen-like protein C [Hypanus sabinus]|uniref:CD209 antigen-like protein C n=1 Tax=Hypanus sabinus TaxID=79690 RepID=UPI0028C4CCA6|nr:CD209 antigen-like protein C [Hypanus sabinus]